MIYTITSGLQRNGQEAKKISTTDTVFREGRSNRLILVATSLVEVTVTMALTALAGTMIGLVISALAPNTDRALSLVPIVLIPQVIFSGTVFKLDTPLLQVIGDLFAMRWAMAGMGSSVGLHGDKLGVDDFAYQGTHFATFDPAAALPGAILHLLLVWAALTAMIILLSLLISFFLKRKDTRV